MNKYSFRDNLEFGNIYQNVVVNYLTKNMGYSFIAGDINGTTVGSSEIEKIFNCKFHPIISGKKGASLEFVDDVGNSIIFTMPDELLLKKEKINIVGQK